MLLAPAKVVQGWLLSYDLDDSGFGVYGIIGLARSDAVRACI